MIVLGLTGSIGMGKSATLALFAEMGAAIYDADASVHALYAKGGAAVAPVGAAFSGVVKDGAIDREALSAHVLGDDQKLRHLEAIVHPLTSASRAAFFETARSANVKIALLEVPLLYETGGDQSVDAVVVCSAPFAVQKERALKRPSMTRQKFKAIVAKQIPDSAKRAKADYVVDTSRGLDDARAQVAAILNDVKSPAWRSRAKQANNPA